MAPSVLYLTTVYALFSIAVAVSTHLCVVCGHFCCPTCMSLFQGHVACQNFTLTGPHCLHVHFNVKNTSCHN